jgi:hypothetical protein
MTHLIGVKAFEMAVVCKRREDEDEDEESEIVLWPIS